MSKRIAISTGGGDAPGLNAVIRAVVLSSLRRGWTAVGIRQGYNGLLEGEGTGVVELTREHVRGITHHGGTILGTTSRGNPFAWPMPDAEGQMRPVDRSREIVERLHGIGVDALIAIGGDGSLEIARVLSEHGLNVVGVPKTIDNDLASTVVTFGFHTAVETATEAIGRLHSTAQAHERVMVVELMGRHTGWIALFAGLAGTADVILIPEIPYSLERVTEKIRARYEGGARFAIVVVAEGACAAGEEHAWTEPTLPGTRRRYGGIGERLTHQIQELTGYEARCLVLGHLQRGGAPNAYDRLLGLRFGAAAVQMAADGCYGCMVALDPPNVVPVPLADAVRELKRVPLDGDVIQTARSMGIALGD